MHLWISLPIATVYTAGWGLFVCVLAMLAAAAVEWRRLQLYRHGHVLHLTAAATNGAGDSDIVDMNVFWQVPQYLLIGLSEVRVDDMALHGLFLAH